MLTSFTYTSWHALPFHPAVAYQWGIWINQQAKHEPAKFKRALPVTASAKPLKLYADVFIW